jgi:translocation and assembly module TamB
MTVLRRIGRILRWVPVVVVALVGGALLSVNTPAGKRVVMTRVNALLATTFQGKLVIHAIGHIGLLSGVTGVDATLDDPSGKRLLSAEGLRVDLGTIALLRSVLLDTGQPMRIDLFRVEARSAYVDLDTDAQGNLGIAQAFQSAAPSQPRPPGASSREVRVTLHAIDIAHVDAHGDIAGAPRLDAGVDALRGSFALTGEALDLDVGHAQLVARGIVNGNDAAGALQGHLHLPLSPGKNPEGRVAWDGRVAGIAQTVRASLASDVVDATVDVPEAKPEEIRKLWAASTLSQPATLHVTAHGPLTGVDLGLHAGLGAAAVDGTGRVAWGADRTASLSLRGRDLDVHELSPSAPRSRLGLNAQLSGAMRADGGLSGDGTVHFLGGSLGATELPTATIRASASRSHDLVLHGSADVQIAEPGAPTHLTAQLAPAQGRSTIHVTVDSNVDDFQRLPQLGHGVDGSANLTGAGTVDLSRETFDADLRLHARGLAQGTTRVSSATVDVFAHGALSAPDLDVTARMHEVRVAGRRIDLAIATAKGTTTAAHLTASLRGPDTPDLDARAELGLQHGVALDDLRVKLSRGADRAEVTAREVGLAGSAVVVEDAKVVGLGRPLTATASIRSGELDLSAKTDGLDLAILARLLHLEGDVQRGKLVLDSDVRVRRGLGEGRVALDVSGLESGRAHDLSVHADVTMTGRTLAATVHAEAPAAFTLDVAAPHITVAGSTPIGLGSWRQAFGAADVEVHTDLAKLVALLPAQDVPVGEAGGQVALRAHLARDGVEDITPDITVDLSTQQLRLGGRAPAPQTVDGGPVVAPWRLTGVDVALSGIMNGDTGAVHLAGEARDAKGPIVGFEASSQHVPYADIFGGDTDSLVAHLRTMDVALDVGVPERSLGSLPALLQQSFVRGRFKANVDLRGSVAAPTLSVAAELRRADFAGEMTNRSMDLAMTARYDGRRGDASIKATSRNQDLLDLTASVEAAAADLLDPSALQASPWTASMRAHLNAFPLGSIVLLDDKLVSGTMSGDVDLTDLHKDARGHANLTIDDLSVGSVPYKSAKLQLTADGQVIDAQLRIDQVDGFAEAKAHAAATWGLALAPRLDPGKPLDATLESKNLRIAALAPFFGGTIDEIDGRVDTNTQIELDPRDGSARLKGALDLTRGTVEASAGGGELHDIAAHVTFAPDGTITLEKLTASGISGSLQASGSAHLAGTTLQSARATLTIPSRSAVPLTVSGIEIGNVDGRVDLTATAAPNGGPMVVQVTVPSLDVELSESATNSPQSLGPMEKVRIGAHRGGSAQLTLLPLDPSPPRAAKAGDAKGGGLTIAARLDQVHVTRDTELAVDLDGSVKVVTGARSAVTGQIRLKRGGSLDVQGRKFTIQDGTVTFVDDPANPQVIVKAAWTAPDATLVIATFTGPLKTGKVTLTSEPQLPQEEIVQLLLFGSADGTQAQGAPASTQDSAIATAGGEAAQPLNHMFNQLGLGAVTAKVDTANSSNPKPEVEVQIARDLSLQIAVVLGQPQPGVNPDHTLATVDWRFLKMWSLATTVGDAGTTIFDLLWQRRY